MTIFVVEIDVGSPRDSYTYTHSAWSTRALADECASVVEKHSDVIGTEVREIVVDAPGNL